MLSDESTQRNKQLYKQSNINGINRAKSRVMLKFYKINLLYGLGLNGLPFLFLIVIMKG